jgi:hypothetical protein
MVQKPQAVTSRSEAADAMIRAAAGSPRLASEQPGNGAPAPAPQMPAPSQEASPDQPASPPVPDRSHDDPGKPAAQFHPMAAPADPEPDPDPEPDAASYEHRFKVLQGKYKAETRRYRDETEDLKAQVRDLRSLLATVQEQIKAPKSVEAPAPAAAPRPLVSDKEIEEYGADLLDAAKRFVMQDVGPQLAAINDALAKLNSKVSEAASTATTARATVTQSARDRMLELLTDKMPDWREVNTDDDFLEWLEKEDEMSGESRYALLRRAYERNDGPRVLTFFKKYKAEAASGGEAASASSTPRANGNTAPAAAAGNGRVDPNALVAPGRGRAAPHSAQPPQIQWTPATIAQFYNDVRRGAFKNPDEIANLERDIFAAQTEGRIVSS